MREIGLILFYGLTSFDDLKTKQVRVFEIVSFAIFGIVLNIVAPLNSMQSIIAAVLVGIVLYIFSILSKEKIGKGDALIVMVSGLYLGFTNVLILLWISSLLALIFGLITIKKLKVDSNYEIPFVPFLMSGFLIMYAISLYRSLYV